MQNKIIPHFLDIPTEMIFRIFSYLNEADLKVLKATNVHKLTKLLENYTFTCLFYEKEIIQLVKKLGLIIETKKIFLGLRTLDQYKTMNELLHFFEKRPSANEIPNNTMHLMRSLGRTIPENPIVKLYVSDFNSSIIATTGLQSSFLNPLMLERLNFESFRSYESSERHILVDKLMKEVKNHFESGNQAVYFTLIHIGLRYCTVMVPCPINNKNLPKVDCSFLKQLPVPLNVLPNRPYINPFPFIQIMLNKLNLRMPVLSQIEIQNDKNGLVHLKEWHLTRLFEFLLTLNWLDFFYHPQQALEGLETLIAYIEQNLDKNFVHIQKDSFHYLYKTPSGSKWIQFCIENDVRYSSLPLKLINSSVSELVLQKLKKSKNIEDFLSKLLQVLKKFDYSLVKHPKLVEEIMDRLLKGEKIDLIPAVENLISYFLDVSINTCWKIQDFNTYFTDIAKLPYVEKKALAVKTRILYETPALLSYLPQEEVSNICSLRYESETWKQIFEILDSSNQYLIFKRFRKFECIYELYNTPVSPKSSTNLLFLLSKVLSHSICEWILIQNETLASIQQYIKENKEYLHVIHCFKNVEKLLEFTGNTFHPRNIKNINLAELQAKLEIFREFEREKFSIEDCLMLTFKVPNRDVDKITYILKDNFVKEYLSCHCVSVDFIAAHCAFFKSLISKINSENASLFIHLYPEYLIRFYLRGLLELLLNQTKNRLIWLLFNDELLENLRPLEQVEELLNKQLLECIKFFDVLEKDSTTIKYNWFDTFINKIKDIESVMKLLTPHYFNNGKIPLAVIGEQGEYCFTMIMQNFSSKESADISCFLKEWYSKSWLIKVNSVDRNHEIFKCLTLAEMEKIGRDEQLLFYLLSNIKLHIKLFELTTLNFTIYCKILKIFSEIDHEKEESLLLLIKQFSALECIHLYNDNFEIFHELLTLNKWDLIKVISDSTFDELPTKIAVKKRTVEERLDSDTHLAKRYKSNEEKDDRLTPDYGLRIS